MMKIQILLLIIGIVMTMTVFYFNASIRTLDDRIRELKALSCLR